MSYQAIADIAAGYQNAAQLQTPQISDIPRDTLNNSQNLSFSQIMTSLQNDNTSESVKSENVDQNQKKKTDDVRADRSFEEKSEKTEKVEFESDEDRINDVKEPEKNSKSTGGQRDEKKSKTVIENTEKPVEKDSKTKKLTKKDFSKISQLEENSFEKQIENLENRDDIKNAQDSGNVKHSKNDAKSNDTDDKGEEPAVSEKIISTEKSFAVPDNQIKADGKKAEEFKFSKEPKEIKKEFSLDKGGKITVQDLRSEKTDSADTGKKQNLKGGGPKLTGESAATFTMELNQKVEQNVLSLNNQTAASNGSNFQAMLNNQIQTSVPEFVKAGNLILKDNNQGTINLILHPDDIGNVKIHLSLDGKTLNGHITVASKEALQVFKDNSETLREAFLKNGFESANFDVSYNNSSFGQNQGFAEQNDGTDYLAKQVYGNSGSSLSSELENILANAEDISNYSVNIIA